MNSYDSFVERIINLMEANIKFLGMEKLAS